MFRGESFDQDGVFALHDAGNATRQLSFADDVPSRGTLELSAGTRDDVIGGGAEQDQGQHVRQLVEYDVSARSSASTFDRWPTRSTFYRDSPSPTRTPDRRDPAAADGLNIPLKKLRFDNDISDSDDADASHASAVSYETALSEIDATASGQPLFEETRGEPLGFTFTTAHLGAGAFGVVSVAVREYAAKCADGKNPDAVAECTEGVALLRRVKHENIVRMKKAFHDVRNDLYYVVMDKMEGSVAHFIQHNRGFLTEEHALVILRCTASALDHLHRLGFVHRDVKSDNVLVGRNCEVKLADLDSAAAENAWLIDTAGTPHWVAPEVVRIICKQSDAPYAAKVDAWSFAIFATEFPLGGPPFLSVPIYCTICNPQYVGCVNDMVRAANWPDVARLVESCLKSNPAERPRMSDVKALMSSLPETDQRIILEPIQRMVRCQAAAAGDEETRKEAECVQLRQNVVNLQAQLKSSEKLVAQLASATAVIGTIYEDNAEHIRRAEATEKKAAKAIKEAAEAKKQAVGWKTLARTRKRAMLKAKKDNVDLARKLKELERASTSRRREAEPDRRIAAQPRRADAIGADPVVRRTM